MKNKDMPLSSPNKWGEKPYYSFDFYLKQTFGQKVYKIALDGGMTCPNRDGTIATGGCIFCSEGGSGDFAVKREQTVTGQINTAIQRLETGEKNIGQKYIAYFQSFSNTYAPIERLRRLYTEALSHPSIVGLSIATRPDCFSEEIYDLIEACNQKKPTWIELGLQTIHDSTAEDIGRGYPLSTFYETVSSLRKRNIPVIVHVILGLPGETDEMMLQTIRSLNKCDIQGIKLQLLHVLKNTKLATIFAQHKFEVLSEEHYVNLVILCLQNLSPDIVIHRLTGDGPKSLLIAPDWSKNKRGVLNHIAHELQIRNAFQGQYYREN